jgi:hypothetical protein
MLPREVKDLAAAAQLLHGQHIIGHAPNVRRDACLGDTSTGIRLPDGLSVSSSCTSRALFGTAPLQGRQVGAERGVAPNRRGAGNTRRGKYAARLHRAPVPAQVLTGFSLRRIPEATVELPLM